MHVRQRRLGEVFIAPCDIVFAASTVLEPDIFFVSTARSYVVGEKYLTGPPDLVVEVLSEGSARHNHDACQPAVVRAYFEASGARKGLKGKSGEKPARSRHCKRG